MSWIVFTGSYQLLIPPSWFPVLQNQWKKKKQTKEEARQARRAKLDPDSAKSAKDVLEGRAKKRKRDEKADVDSDGIEGADLEKPKEGMRKPETKGNKKKKKKTTKTKGREEEKEKDAKVGPETNNVATSKDGVVAKQPRSAKRPPPVTEKENESKTETQKSGKKEEGTSKETIRAGMQKTHQDVDDEQVAVDFKVGREDSVGSDRDRRDKPSPDHLHTTINLAAGLQSPPASTVSLTPALDPPALDEIPEASISSASSMAPTKRATIKRPLVDSETLRARLLARIEALRAARHADGPDGKPARNRQELIEARRKKEEQRRAHKKELRLKAKQEEHMAREPASSSTRLPEQASLSGTSRPPGGNTFSFGRIAFKDGQQVDASLSHLLDRRRTKGPQDPLGAMKSAKAKQARLNGLDEPKRKEIEEKDVWLKARKRVQGEKIRDDPSLLKKTLKRQEKIKAKSELEWTDRLAGVEKAKEMRQKKREENIRKRRDEKGPSGKKAGKVQKRPGFEGTFRAKPRTKNHAS